MLSPARRAARTGRRGLELSHPPRRDRGRRRRGTDRIKSAIGIGSLLCDGLGDTIRVSLTEDSPREIEVCNDLLAQIPSCVVTAVAVPVLVGRRVAAVLEFFSERVVQPDEGITDAMLSVGIQLGRVIERAEFEEHLLTTAEEIQRRIAQDLHDNVGQELTGLGLKAATLVEMLATAKTPAGELAADIVAALKRTHEKVRGLARGMLPLELEEGLLADAIEQLARATSRKLA